MFCLEVQLGLLKNLETGVTATLAKFFKERSSIKFLELPPFFYMGFMDDLIEEGLQRCSF